MGVKEKPHCSRAERRQKQLQPLLSLSEKREDDPLHSSKEGREGEGKTEKEKDLKEIEYILER